MEIAHVTNGGFDEGVHRCGHAGHDRRNVLGLVDVAVGDRRVEIFVAFLARRRIVEEQLFGRFALFSA